MPGTAPLPFSEGTGDVATSPSGRHLSQENLAAGGSVEAEHSGKEQHDQEHLSISEPDGLSRDEIVNHARTDSAGSKAPMEGPSRSPNAVSSTTFWSDSQAQMEKDPKTNAERAELSKFSELYRDAWRRLQKQVLEATESASQAHGKGQAIAREAILPATLFDEISTLVRPPWYACSADSPSHHPYLQTAEYLGYLFHCYFTSSKESLLFTRIAKSMLGQKATMPVNDDQFARLGCIGKGSYSHVYACRKKDTGKVSFSCFAFLTLLNERAAVVRHESGFQAETQVQEGHP